MTAVQRVDGVRPWSDSGQVTEGSSARAGIERRPASGSIEDAAELLRCATPGTMIEALQIFSRDLQRGAGTEAILNKKNDVDATRVRIDIAVARAAHEAEERAEKQERIDTLLTVAKVAAIVVAVASVVVTWGASTPAVIALVGTLISTFGSDINEAAGGNDLSEKILVYGGAALSIVGGGAGIFMSAAAATSTGATAAQTVAAHVSKAAAVVGAGATGAAAYQRYQAGVHASNETDARADEAALRAQRQKMLREVDLMIDVLKQVEKSFNASMTALASARENEAASNLTLSAGIRA